MTSNQKKTFPKKNTEVVSEIKKRGRPRKLDKLKNSIRRGRPRKIHVVSHVKENTTAAFASKTENTLQ